MGVVSCVLETRGSLASVEGKGCIIYLNLSHTCPAILVSCSLETHPSVLYKLEWITKPP